MPILNGLGIDPSLRNWGLNHCCINSDSSIFIKETHILHTSNNKSVKPNISDVLSAEHLYKSIREYAMKIRPQVIVIELPIGSQSYSAAVSYAICIGLIGAMKTWGIPVIAVTPFDVKRIIGSRETSKQEIVDWVISKHPEVQFPLHGSKINMSKAEHIADSIVAVHASLLKPEMKEIINAYHN